MFATSINNMSEKNLSDLGIDQLKEERKKVLERKDYYSELYTKLKHKKQDAAALAHSQKKFLPPSEFRNLENKLKEYHNEIEKLQKLSGDINSEIKKKEAFIFERMFVNVCKEKLSMDKWNELFEETKFRILKGS